MPFLMHQFPLVSNDALPDWALGSDYSTFNATALVAGITKPQWLMVWCNHARGLTAKANQPTINGRGFLFTTVAKANMATIAYITAAFQSQDAARRICANHGLRFVPWFNLSGLAKATIKAGDYVDTIVCPPPLTGICVGFVLDYEVGDDRSSSVSLAFLRNIADRFPGLPRIFYTNEIGAPHYLRSGLDGIEPVIARRYHSVSVLQQENERNLLNQARAYNCALSRVYVVVDMASNSLTSIQWVKALVDANNMAGVNIWRNGLSVESDEWTAKMAVFTPWLEA